MCLFKTLPDDVSINVPSNANVISISSIGLYPFGVFSLMMYLPGSSVSDDMACPFLSVEMVSIKASFSCISVPELSEKYIFSAAIMSKVISGRGILSVTKSLSEVFHSLVSPVLYISI